VRCAARTTGATTTRSSRAKSRFSRPTFRSTRTSIAPRGHLVLSTPNLQRLHSRWKFFWTGTHKLIRERPGRDVAPAELYAYHINPLDLPLAHTLLHQAGLRVTRLRVTRVKPEHAWLLLFYPLIWMATRMEIRDPELFR
jgi:hypothetical protein